MKNEVLPLEIQEMAKGVSIEKKNEVQSVLNNVFDGVSKMREQLDSIIVVDENDKVNMKLANIIRLGVRQERLSGEKTFNEKRAEVQQEMLSFKTLDSLWLKSKQTMQILTKELEENARWKEETAKRFETEQKEIKTQKRENLLSKFNPEILRNEFENMGDETFKTLLSGIEKAYNDKIEAEKAEAKRIEDERIAKEKAIEAQRLENERLKKEAEAQAKVEAKRVAKEIAEAKERQLKDKAAQEKQNAILRKEREAREKVEAELKAKKDAELKAIKDAEDKAKSEEASRKKSLLAPDKIKLENLAKEIVKITLPELKSDEAKEVLKKVQILLNKTSNYIKEESVKL